MHHKKKPNQTFLPVLAGVRCRFSCQCREEEFMIDYQMISGIELAKESGLFRICKAGMRETDHSE
jgi:hypothetical protein